MIEFKILIKYKKRQKNIQKISKLFSKLIQPWHPISLCRRLVKFSKLCHALWMLTRNDRVTCSSTEAIFVPWRLIEDSFTSLMFPFPPDTHVNVIEAGNPTRKWRKLAWLGSNALLWWIWSWRWPRSGHAKWQSVTDEYATRKKL